MKKGERTKIYQRLQGAAAYCQMASLAVRDLRGETPYADAVGWIGKAQERLADVKGKLEAALEEAKT